MAFLGVQWALELCGLEKDPTKKRKRKGKGKENNHQRHVQRPVGDREK